MLSYDILAVEGLKEVLEQVSNTCSELQIDFFLVGAVSRNIWLASHGENPSGTKDIDFGVFVPSLDEYNELKRTLIEKYDYSPSSENEFCMFTSDGKQIDLLPFGEIEENDQVMLEGKGLAKLNLDGFKEAHSVGAQEVTIGTETYKVCTIPAMVVLKMIAFDDRPEMRIKDVLDINAICMHYPAIESELIWEEYSDLYEEDREHSEVAMIVLGKEMKKIIGENEKLQNRMEKILDDAIHERSTFLKHMITDPENETLEQKSKLLAYIKQGIASDPTTSST